MSTEDQKNLSRTTIDINPLENFQVPVSPIPDPKRVKQAFADHTAKIDAQIEPDYTEAAAQLREALKNNKPLNRLTEYLDSKQDVDTTYSTKLQVIETKERAVMVELNTLLQKQRHLTQGALKDARKRVQAEARNTQRQIQELSELRDTLKDVIDLGIEVPSADAEDGSVLGESDIEAINQQITTLQEKVANDPVLNLVTKNLEMLEKSVESRKTQLDTTKEERINTRESWKQACGDLRTGIQTDRRQAVETAQESFDDISSQRGDILAELKEARDKALSAEKADAAEYRANRRASALETTTNTASGALTSLKDAFVKAWQTFTSGVQESYAAPTQGQANNEELVERRLQQAAALQTQPKP